MSGQHIGYVRVSSVDQNTDRQLDGAELAQTYHSHFTQREIQDMVLFSHTQWAKICALYATAARRDGTDWSTVGSGAAASVEFQMLRDAGAKVQVQSSTLSASLQRQ